MRYSSRRDAPSAEPHELDTGTLDFRNLRAWLECTEGAFDRGCHMYWQAGAQFRRDASSGELIQMLLVGVPIDAVAYASPLWLPFALRAADSEVRRVPAGPEHDVAVELQLTLDPSAIAFHPQPPGVAAYHESAASREEQERRPSDPDYGFRLNAAVGTDRLSRSTTARTQSAPPSRFTSPRTRDRSAHGQF